MSGARDLLIRTIKTKPSTKEYREGWERVFGKQSKEEWLNPDLDDIELYPYEHHTEDDE